MKSDPAIAEIRVVRRKISAEFGHDPRRLMAHYVEYENQLQREGESRFAHTPAVGTEQAELNAKSQKELP